MLYWYEEFQKNSNFLPRLYTRFKDYMFDLLLFLLKNTGWFIKYTLTVFASNINSGPKSDVFIILNAASFKIPSNLAAT